MVSLLLRTNWKRSYPCVSRMYWKMENGFQTLWQKLTYLNSFKAFVDYNEEDYMLWGTLDKVHMDRLILYIIYIIYGTHLSYLYWAPGIEHIHGFDSPGHSPLYACIQLPPLPSPATKFSTSRWPSRSPYLAYTPFCMAGIQSKIHNLLHLGEGWWLKQCVQRVTFSLWQWMRSYQRLLGNTLYIL